VTAGPVLRKVESYDELVRHQVPVPMRRLLQGGVIPGRAYRHLGPVQPDAAPLAPTTVARSTSSARATSKPIPQKISTTLRAGGPALG
jgi:hypothetical protein